MIMIRINKDVVIWIMMQLYVPKIDYAMNDGYKCYDKDVGYQD